MRPWRPTETRTPSIIKPPTGSFVYTVCRSTSPRASRIRRRRPACDRFVSLQWGGRFSSPPDPALLAFGSSLEEDLLLAPFDLMCSRAHVAALQGGAILSQADAFALLRALDIVDAEIASGEFAAFARGGAFED